MKVCIKCNINKTSKWYSGPICRSCYRKSIYKAKESPNSIKSCIECNEAFADSTNSQNKKYCSKRCANKFKYISKPLVDKKCQYCSYVFKTNKKNKIYCSKKCCDNYHTKKNELHLNEKIKHRLRSRLWQALKNNYKSGSAVRDLCCSIEGLKFHLEKQFQPGMTWDNWSRDGWHIDHIIPLSSFNLTDSEELKKACHYSNLQPMWKSENLKKSNKVAQNE